MEEPGTKADPRRPTTIGRYRVKGELGRGAMGLVYEAEDTTLGRTVAIKTIELAFAVDPADRDVFERRFLAEARIAARLSHPGIVVCHDVGKDPETGVLYIVLEHLQGASLADHVKPGRLLPPMDAVAIAAKVARALHYAHAHGVVHRDMKPANVMLLPSGDPKILDFGVAKLEGGQLTAAGQFFGSPLYMSPEQAYGKLLDGRSDLFSLGSILYGLLTGHHPFAAESIPMILTRVIGEDPPAVSRIVSGLPESLDYAVARALAKDPADRYASGDQLAEDLDDVAAGREPRHRAGWTRPVGSHTLAGDLPDADPIQELESLVEAPPSAEPTRRHVPVRAPVPPPPAKARSPRTRRWPTAVLALAALGAGYMLFGQADRRPAPPTAPATLAPAAAPDAAPVRGAGQAELQLVLRHFVRTGQVRVFVDDELALDTEIRAQSVKKIVAVTIREGRYTNTLLVPAGKHEVRVEVEWDDNRRVLNTFANFTDGATRTLDLELVRITRTLEGGWR